VAIRPADLARFSPWLGQPATAGVLCDFDGTLSAIVDQPELAVPLEGAVAALEALAARYGLAAVISGRPVSYLIERLGRPDGLLLVGLYGLERSRGPHIDQLPEAQPWRLAVETAAAAAEASAPPGAHVERKGLTLTLHVRGAPAASEWMEATAAEQAVTTGLVAHPGRMSIELRPPLGIDKGAVVSELSAGLEAVCFFGDDRGDLPAFAALGDLRAKGALTLAVAVESPEMPPELAAAADLRVFGPEDVVTLLRHLAAVR